MWEPIDRLRLRGLAGLCSLILTVVLASGSAQAQVATPNLLTDFGFEPGSQPLVAFNANTTDRWAAEDATLIVGTDGGISPIRFGMLRINQRLDSASQVLQTIDVTDHQAEIDAGLVCARARASFNSPTAGSVAVITLSAFTGGPRFGGGVPGPTTTTSTVIPANTWTQLGVGEDFDFVLPSGTTHVEVQVAYTNTTIPQDAYVDATFLELESQLLSDGGFNSGSQPLLGFGTTTLDRWAAEDAALLAVLDGVSPSQGDGMLCVNDNSPDVTSQVRQENAVATGPGPLVALARAEFNSPTAGSKGGIVLTALTGPRFGGGTVLGYTATLAADQDVDGNTATWEPKTLALELPAGTQIVETQVFYVNGGIPQGGCVDVAVTKLHFEPRVPLLSPMGLVVLAAGLGFAGRRAVRRRGRVKGS